MTVTANTQKITDDQITEYCPLVKNIAYKFKNSGEPLEDLEQVGYIGLGRLRTSRLHWTNQCYKPIQSKPGYKIYYLRYLAYLR